MMAGLFLLMSIAIAVLYFRLWKWGVIVLFATFILCWVMLWHHATSVLQINW